MIRSGNAASSKSFVSLYTPKSSPVPVQLSPKMNGPPSLEISGSRYGSSGRISISVPTGALIGPWYVMYSRVCGISFQMNAGLVNETTQLRSEEHTSELQSLRHLVCRLLL